MRKWTIALLIVIAVASIGVALSYPISYFLAQRSNSSELEELAELRRASIEESERATAGPEDVATPEPTASATPEATDTPTPAPTATLEPTRVPGESIVMDVYLDPDVTPDVMDLILIFTPTPEPTATPVPTPTPSPSPSPSPTPDRSVRESAVAYRNLKRVELDVDRILPELRNIYARNHDVVGWLDIFGTVINYPVVQCDDPDYYLNHDFYGNENRNGQIILDPQCDPYTPSYNLVISGHHMANGTMFGNLPLYQDKSYWESHKFLEFDSLMERNRYVIFAAFHSADYDENEEGFRYSADLQYKVDVEPWLEEVRLNQIYDTGIDVEYGDEIITLTTCYRNLRQNGRFVVVARKIREGETIE